MTESVCAITLFHCIVGEKPYKFEVNISNAAQVSIS